MYGDPMLCHQIPLWEWKPDPTRCSKDCQLIGLSCPPCLRIILAEDYSLTQGHAPSEGRLYPRLTSAGEKGHAPGTKEGPPSLAGIAGPPPPLATPAPSPWCGPQQQSPVNILLTTRLLRICLPGDPCRPKSQTAAAGLGGSTRYNKKF